MIALLAVIFVVMVWCAFGVPALSKNRGDGTCLGAIRASPARRALAV
jgi:hypothetical protein